jgi:hypothetical protein
MAVGLLAHAKPATSLNPQLHRQVGAVSPAPGQPTPRQLTLALLLLGVACRAVRYFLQFPYWGDEAYLCLNFVHRDYAGLAGQLENNQVAPIFFLWGELTAYRLLGSSELALRLLPFLASLGGLALFAHLARRALPPRAALLAVGILSVARWPVTMGAVVKPYSLDLLLALALLTPSVHWLRRPQRTAWLALLAALAPLALAGSYPAAFVAGGVSLALLPTVCRRRRAAEWALYATYNLLTAATFLACHLLVGREQLDPVAGSVQDFMRGYWADGFPPAQPLALLRWLALINTGRLFAYPVGGSDGGSTLTFLLFTAGVVTFWKAGRRPLLVLCLAPFALNLLAAALGRYPYGACCRLSQHLAPAVCLLAGAGAATLAGRLARTPPARRRWVQAACALLALCGVAQMVVDAVHPYREDEALWSRRMARELAGLAGPGEAIVVAGKPSDVWPVLRWQLERLGGRVSWGGATDWRRIEAEGGRVWLLTPWIDDAPPEALRLPEGASRHADDWALLDRTAYSLRRAPTGAPNQRCDLSCWARPGAAQARPTFSCWP